MKRRVLLESRSGGLLEAGDKVSLPGRRGCLSDPEVMQQPWPKLETLPMERGHREYQGLSFLQELTSGLFGGT